MKPYIQPHISTEQAGFVEGKGTREQILNIRQIIEKSREFCVPVFICFLDYRKAFDCVVWEKLWRVLAEFGVPPHLIALIKSLYNNHFAAVKTSAGTSVSFRVSKGVRQGCVLSPQLYNIYAEYVIRKALDGWTKGISIGGRTINNLRFADDTVLFANSEDELAALLTRIKDISVAYGLDINLSKSKLMVIDRGEQIQLTGRLKELEVVHSFIYLGSTLCNTGSCEDEIRRRITLGRVAMKKLTKIWQSRAITNSTKIRLVETLVFSVFFYGCETWTLKARDKQRIDAFELWCWRRMLRIKWTERRTNVSIIKQLKISRRLSSRVDEKILQFFGHIVRRDGENLEKIILQGKIEGTRPRGRTASRWIDQITKITGLPLQQALREAGNRPGWRRLVHGVTTLSNEHDD